ncbi:MAG: hypothetical protein KBS60_04190 [Phascolarctobacterium sp.]|nr:hypothetical protein [Candidatus Phascolarctobacterium caballi]
MKDVIKSAEKVNGYRIYKIVDTANHSVKYGVNLHRFDTPAEAIAYANTLKTGKDK